LVNIVYDTAVISLGNDEVVILYGYGHGSFELAREYLTGCGIIENI